MSSKGLVITISREHGSGGRQIAQEVARKLKLPFVDSQIIRSSTQQLGISEEELAEFDEKVLPQLDEISKLLSRVQVGEHEVALSEALAPERGPLGIPKNIIAGSPDAGPTDADLERKAAIHKGYHQLIESLIREVAAREGAVILGRGAQFVLKNRPHTAHIHVYAPVANRIQRLMQLQHVSQGEAERQILHSDEQRANYVRHYYHANWSDPVNYHLVLNTANLILPTAVATIIQLGQSILAERPGQEVNATYERFDQESYSLKEASELLWVSPGMLREAILRGDLKALVVNHKASRISRDALMEWLHKS